MNKISYQLYYNNSKVKNVCDKTKFFLKKTQFYHKISSKKYSLHKNMSSFKISNILNYKPIICTFYELKGVQNIKNI